MFGKIEEHIVTLSGVGADQARQQTFLYFCFALVPAALCCFLAVLTARAELRQRVAGFLSR